MRVEELTKGKERIVMKALLKNSSAPIDITHVAINSKGEIQGSNKQWRKENDYGTNFRFT